MPMKRSSESSARDGVFLIHSLTKTLCSSPEETDFNKQTHFQQEDDSGIKSGNETTIPNEVLFLLGVQTEKAESLIFYINMRLHNHLLLFS